jgi:hypothetical protein
MSIKFTESEVNEEFVPFAIKLIIEDKDQLIALHDVVGRLCNGHGLELYPFLDEKVKRLEYGDRVE